MGITIDYIEGQTPLDDDEKEGLLIDTVTTRQELDEFEQQNIERAVEWTIQRKFKADYILSEEFVRELHKKMFGEVWSWSGTFRKTIKSFGVPAETIGIELRQLVDDCKFWIQNKTYGEDEIAIRFKHRIVQIHCFANGNGRHSRLMADIIISHIFNAPVFTWGGKIDLVHQGESRTAYLAALKKADGGDIKPLIKFSRKE
jgi:Fic-DOC domain mobile mystery protein B